MSGQSIVGDLRFGFFVGGSFAGYFDIPLNASVLTVTPGESTSTERISNNRETSGQALGSFQNVTAAPTVAITFDELIREALEVALLGNSADIAISSGSASDESVTALELDRWMPLANANITTGTVVVTSDPAGTNFALDTDYAVDLRNGLIKFLSTGGISKKDPLLVSYDHTGVGGFSVSPFTQQQVKTRLLMDGTNREDNHRIRALIWEANLRPTNGFSLVGPADGFNTVDAEGTIITPAGQTSPMIWEDHGPET